LTVVLLLLLYGSEVLLSELCHSLCMLVQMIACRDRGFSFTRALLGLAVDELHLCGDPAAVSIVDQILATTGDTFEVIISSLCYHLYSGKKSVKHSCCRGFNS